MNNLFEQLSKPFEPKYMSWKPGMISNGKCLALAYADLRAYQERLDDVCGIDWSCRFIPWSDNRIICELTIHGVTRSSTGESDAQDEKNGLAGSVSEAMSFKRACAAFGLGRYLYSLPSAWVPVDGKKISKAGQEELDRRYATWYKRTRAASVDGEGNVVETAYRIVEPPSTSNDDQYTIDPATGEILESTDAPTESPPHQRLFGQGATAFGLDWNNGARAWLISNWTEKVAKTDVRESAADLSDTEKDQLADYISDNLRRLQNSWRTHKASIVQSTEQAKATPEQVAA